MIALIDYGAGNLRSVYKALKFLGADVQIVTKPEETNAAHAMVLPGVGAFDDCIQALDKQHMLQSARDFIKSGRPFLGICVGYQALFEKSEEFNSCALGLNVFGGKVVKFPENAGIKIPQIGWNQVWQKRPDCPLYKDIPDGSHFYFVHSFYPQPVDPSIVATTTDYGIDFTSSVWRDNVYATQFHPEKSQKAGLQLLKNFIELAE
ncbi:MAG: imidazole glycerol phosphate synthase subunit HisH [Verrucomicrobiota bacterium]